jgi:hypothetical protein
MPCAACLQVLVEFCDPEMPIIVDEVGEFRLRDLLPIPFLYPIDGTLQYLHRWGVGTMPSGG